MGTNKNNNLQNLIIFFSTFAFCLDVLFCQINDNYEKQFLENGTYDLLDVTDNHNLQLVVSTSKNIYTGIPPSLKTTTQAELINSTSLISLNENYLLAACLKDSLLGKINLNDGTFENIINYSEVDDSLNLTIPIKSCSISIYENIIFIGYSEINYYKIVDDNNNATIEANKTNIIIKLNIENIDSNPSIIDKKFFIFPISTILTPSTRQISCQPIKITNDENNYRLICLFETLQYDEGQKRNRYHIYATSINNNFDGFEKSMNEVRIYRTNDYSGFRLYKIDEYNAKCLTKKVLYNINLQINAGIASISSKEASKNISGFNAIGDLFDYNNNNLIFFSESSPYYFRINKEISSNYFMIYDDFEQSIFKKIIIYYDTTNDYTLVIIQNENKNYIKYFTLKDNFKIYNIGYYSDIVRIKTNETLLYNLYDLFDFSEYGKVEIDKILTYTSDSSSSKVYAKENNYLIREDNNIIITAEKSLNYWFEYTFLLIEEVQNDYKKLFYITNIKLSIRTCAYQCGSCYEDYYKCDYCRNENYAFFTLNENENNCYPSDQFLKGYFYNSINKSFEQCYISCDFCSEASGNNLEHKCEICKDDYFPSYNNLGNCYQLNDENFVTQDCTKYKIDTTGECIEECPISSPYYSFEFNYINFTEQTNEKITSKLYSKTIKIPPKYLFNNICYESCPLYSLPNDESNTCVCEFGFHIDNNNKIICHPGLYCISDNKQFRYFIDDTKECVTDGCPENYYQFNFRCYKNGCPSDTTSSETDSHQCISNYRFCYINEKFENICNEVQNEEFRYNFYNSFQYLKSCDDSEIYTTYSDKTYLFNNKCYLSCPENTKIDNEEKECICQNYGYYPTEDDIICYGENEKCGSDKIPVIDIKICLNSLEECQENNYKSFNNECYSQNCPDKTTENDDGKTCICSYLYYNNKEEDILNCFEESITECPSENYEFYNPITKECFISLDDCFNKENYYFFNKNCYKNECPNDKIPLSNESNEIKDYYKKNLLLNDENLLDKLCICDINNGVWSNYTSDNQLYFQQCLSQCEEGYENESITNQCLEKIYTTIVSTQPEIATTIIIITSNIITTEVSTILNEPIITQQEIITSEPIITIKTISTTEPFLTIQETINTIILITTIINNEPISTILEEKIKSEIIYPDEYYNNKENCKAIYENKCYQNCPEGTCLTQEDPLLLSCIKISSNVKVFNNICFENFDEITKNIKSMSENDNTIYTESGIIIRGYSTNSNNDKKLDSNYSLIYLGDCENKIIEYYKLDEDIELFILGIDSPNKDSTSSINVYNYGVYLENGTLLDHSLACKDIKIIVSSPITNTDMVKLDKATYFNELGYDIYNENSNFYNDNCASASIDGNDITLSDRKKDFYPANISLCNESCHYSNVDLETKRFTCECDTDYDFEENNEEENSEEEDDSTYFDYFLSLINYKIAICYELFFDYKSYYYNAGFYIAVGTLFFCLVGMIVFLSDGMRSINRLIKDNIPSKLKLKEAIRENNEKRKEFMKNENNNKKIENPPLKKKIIENLDTKKDKEKLLNAKSKFNNNKKKEKKIIKTDGECFQDLKSKNNKIIKKNKSKNNPKINKQLQTSNSLNLLKNKKDKILMKKNGKRPSLNFLKETEGKQMIKSPRKSRFSISKLSISKTNDKNKKRKIEKDEYGLISYINDDQVDKKELNGIPYTQALRIDKRSYFEMLLSVLAHEIGIVDIFYYRNPYCHFSIILSIYVFELCLDLTLNCLLYTDDVVSEKYNNNGSIEFFTSLSLSFMSNIFAGIIAFIAGKLAEYDPILEMIIKNVIKQKEYYINIIKFKKYLTLKLTGFFIIQTIINLGMCYYLMIFCTVYHNTQGSILVNYIIGIAESMIISVALTIFTSLIRYLSIKNKWKSIYYTSKYFFEHF